MRAGTKDIAADGPADGHGPKRGWLEERLDLQGFREKFLKKAFPVHVSFFLGEVALFSFIILVISGIYLAFSYEPSSQEIDEGGQSLPAAYASVRHIDEQPFGLIVRQVHHWSAHIMIVAVILHMLRVFFTGAFKKPREINWVVGMFLLLLSVFAAFSGYLLPYDEFAVTATGIGYGIARTIPWIGPALANFVFAGEFPAPGTIPRFYGYHVMLIPLLLTGLIGLHMVILIKQKHTEAAYMRGRAPEGHLLGIPLWPQQGALMAELFLLLLGGVFLLASLFPVHPVEVYGPPGPQTPAVKPDWYFLWIYGALKLVPGWMEVELWGATIGSEAIGGVLFAGLVILALMAWPFLERSRTAQHHLDRPRQAPKRVAFGVAGIAFMIVLSAAGYEDVLKVPLDVFRIAAVAVPAAVGALVYGTLTLINRRTPVRPSTVYHLSHGPGQGRAQGEGQ